MRDIWAFLLQTLTVSGAAVLILTVKRLFRDRLTPRWQAAVWLVLLIPLLLPARWNGNDVLFPWSLWVESLRTAWTGEFAGLVPVTAPIPLPPGHLPKTLRDWLFLLYLAGVAFFLLRDGAAYLSLRVLASRAEEGDSAAVKAVADRYGLPVRPVRAVRGLPSPFTVGVLRPMLVLPAEGETDEKVLLHELLHCRYHDMVWGLVLSVFRAIHWCNPLLRYCLDRAANDVEALCDQRVLERLEGEERRDYGRILLSMADDRHARCPGTSCIANGSRNIRRRIEAIVRFRLYPAGMGLVSVCLLLVLAVPMVIGVRATGLQTGLGADVAMASARTLRCGTRDGALDTYAGAVLHRNALLRAVCAPLEEQDSLADALEQSGSGTTEGDESWDPGIEAMPWTGYQVYNVEEVGNDVFDGLLVVQTAPSEEEYVPLAYQTVRVWQETGRWVVQARAPFVRVNSANSDFRTCPCPELPALAEYAGRFGDFVLRVRWQTRMVSTGSEADWNAGTWILHTDDTFRTDRAVRWQADYVGSPDRQREYTRLSARIQPQWDEGPYPDLAPVPRTEEGGGGGDNTGSDWVDRFLASDWESPILLGEGWHSTTREDVPVAYLARLAVNGDEEEQGILERMEGRELP